MSDSKRQNESKDRFSEYIGQRLKGHTLQPDENCWNEIEARLKPKRRKTLFWVSSGIAAAILIAVVLLFNNTPVAEDIIIQEPFVDKIQPPIVINKEIKEDQILVTKVTSSQHKPVRQTPIKVIEDITDNESQTELLETIIQEETVIDTDTKTEETAPQNNGPETDKTYFPSVIDKQLAHNIKSAKTGNKGSWQIAAGLGSGGNISLNDKYYDAEPPLGTENPNPGNNNGNIIYPPIYEGGLQPEDFTDFSHGLPLSFGLSVRKNIAKNIALESGLVYTRLSTHFKKQDRTRYEADLILHYLGIPVNLVFNLWDNPSWNIYASGGAMMEKGLRSVYRQKQFLSDRINHTTVKTSINGMQWSLNGGVGISYRLYKDISIYAEPRISYYFDSGQPISTRTENNVIVGINAGIRFDF